MIQLNTVRRRAIAERDVVAFNLPVAPAQQ
jgi:hypothetical protein